MPRNVGSVRTKANGQVFIDIHCAGKRYKIYSVRGKSFGTAEEAHATLDQIRLRFERGEPKALVMAEYVPILAHAERLPQGAQEAWKEEYRLRMFRGAKERAEKKGLPFNIDIRDVIIPDYCPVLGIKLAPTAAGAGRSDCAPSIDRIIPRLGYVRGNVVIISWRANRIKGNATASDLKKIAAWIEYFDHCPPLIDYDNL